MSLKKVNGRLPIITYDSDMLNFINILNQDPNGIKLTKIQRYAIFYLVKGLKSINLWSKIHVLYPMIGGSEYKHKFNLKNAADTNSAYRLSFNTGWTHSSTGALPNGTTGYADTYYIPYNNLTVNDAHLSYFSRTNPIGTGYTVEIGAVRDLSGTTQTVNYQMDLAIKYYQDDNHQVNIGKTSTRINTVISNLNTAGFFLGQRTSSTRLVSYRNGDIIATSTLDDTGGQLPTSSLYLANKLDPNLQLIQPSNRECILASAGISMTDNEVNHFNYIVQYYQSILSRNPLRS